jgi:hypothetical protein
VQLRRQHCKLTLQETPRKQQLLLSAPQITSDCHRLTANVCMKFWIVSRTASHGYSLTLRRCLFPLERRCSCSHRIEHLHPVVEPSTKLKLSLRQNWKGTRLWDQDPLRKNCSSVGGHSNGAEPKLPRSSRKRREQIQRKFQDHSASLAESSQEMSNWFAEILISV